MEFFRRNLFGGIFWEKFFGRIFFGRIILGGFFGRIFLGGFFERIFWEEFYGRNYLVEIIKELIFLSRFCLKFCLNAQGRKEGQEFRSLEVRGKLIALKNQNRLT